MAIVCAFFVTKNKKNMGVMNLKGVRELGKFVFLITMFLTATFAFAQNEPETTKPLTDMEVIRKVAVLDIEGKMYENVTISFKSITPDYFITDKYRVKVKVVDRDGKSIYKKTLKNAFLYVFSNGQIQVGKPNFNQILVTKTELTDDNIGVIREKEGVY
ncbi:hypothetical protein HMPREF9441_00505 [Paraprevotella clara YIT 11840]|uniref:Uncharacterized protein n=2 Tax=Paraprevotella clara TaxID=454154 RepID=G5SMD0_9BACT|nr:hypothetical protein HMPREF9441_00505 [Paraprevotella clara YIT 11840]